MFDKSGMFCLSFGIDTRDQIAKKKKNYLNISAIVIIVFKGGVRIFLNEVNFFFYFNNNG